MVSVSSEKAKFQSGDHIIASNTSNILKYEVLETKEFSQPQSFNLQGQDICDVSPGTKTQRRETGIVFFFSFFLLDLGVTSTSSVRTFKLKVWNILHET